ncbi:response regulator [Paenibacillus aceris]|uniref:YesN/AraC family two-component response regulator n=1 Tax=Paenibacillus aceris TaxID=869555 RepID=A0ABS4I2H0_9BACL|nr:response regulator [Paenibacillus aceris]MBP1964940.1 YesN/AraC family two-component response regulator [Paenibacillus aceris]NHW35601.1 response regulator [Paenibacillus aceris]
MIKMIVVDDEVWVRERLIHTIEWDQLGIEVVDEANCGKEALDKALQVEPDIILTDIRMPNMDGLDLIQSLRDRQIRTKVIIISGYSDFEYAQKALSLGAFDYILKPVEDHDLLHVVGKCLEQIQSEKKKEELLHKADEQVNKRLPMLKEMLFANLINGRVQNEQEVLAALSDFQVEHSNLNHFCVIFHFKEWKEDGIHLDAEFKQFVIGNLIGDILQELKCKTITFIHADEVVAIVSSDQETEYLKHQLESAAFSHMLYKIFGCPVEVGYGGCCSNIIDISSSYRQAKQSLLLSGFLNQERITLQAISTKTEKNKQYDIEGLVNSVKLGDKESVVMHLDQLFVNKPMNLIEFKFIYFQIISAITRTVIDGNRSLDDVSRFSLQFFELLQRSQDVGEIRQLFEEALFKIMAYLNKTQTKKKRKVIEKIVEYMQEHYNESINLNTVAEAFFMNASYLSKIFKDDMDVSFSKYVMEYRVEKAIELMKDPTKKIYEIASNVGYDDVQYFTKMFKAIKGVTPVQYRENWAE